MRYDRRVFLLRNLLVISLFLQLHFCFYRCDEISCRLENDKNKNWASYIKYSNCSFGYSRFICSYDRTIRVTYRSETAWIPSWTPAVVRRSPHRVGWRCDCWLSAVPARWHRSIFDACSLPGLSSHRVRYNYRRTTVASAFCKSSIGCRTGQLYIIHLPKEINSTNKLPCKFLVFEQLEGREWPSISSLRLQVALSSRRLSLDFAVSVGKMENSTKELSDLTACPT